MKYSTAHEVLGPCADCHRINFQLNLHFTITVCKCTYVTECYYCH